MFHSAGDREAHCYSTRVGWSQPNLSAPRSSFHIIPVLFGSQESENLSSLGSTGNVGNLRAKPPPRGIPHPELRERSEGGKLSKDGEGDRKRKALLCESSWGLQSQSCSNIERKAAGPSWVRFFCAVTLCHWRRAENSGWLSPWRKHVSLLERPELINKWCPVSSSLPHRKKSRLDLF